jgi:hypothetical protein
MRRPIDPGRKNFSKCDALHTPLVRRRIEFKIPGQGTTDTYGKGSKSGRDWAKQPREHQYEPTFQNKATDATVLPDQLA